MLFQENLLCNIKNDNSFRVRFAIVSSDVVCGSGSWETAKGEWKKIFLLSFLAFSLPHHVREQRCFCCCSMYQPCCFVPCDPCGTSMLWSALVTPAQCISSCDTANQALRVPVDPLAACPALGSSLPHTDSTLSQLLATNQLSHFTMYGFLWNKIIWIYYTQQFWNTAHLSPFWLSLCSRTLWCLWWNHSGECSKAGEGFGYGNCVTRENFLGWSLSWFIPLIFWRERSHWKEIHSNENKRILLLKKPSHLVFLTLSGNTDVETVFIIWQE